MGILVNGIWQEEKTKFCYNSSMKGIKIDYEKLQKKPVANRYVLYTSLASPLAHTSVLVRTIKQLERLVGVCIVSAEKGKQGWEFRKTAVGTKDRYNDCQFLYELYTKSDTQYSGLASVPLIWDNEEKKIVTNCPFEVMSFLNSYFNSLLEGDVNLYPDSELKRIDSFTQFIMEDLYNPIFQTAYASNQEEYDLYSKKVFESLDELESLLKMQQTLLGSHLTIVDWFLFSILIRFDVIFVPLFKLNERKLTSYSALSDYMTFLYQEEHIGCTANINHIKEHYYRSYPHLNHLKIIPKGPEVSFDYLYNRFRLF